MKAKKTKAPAHNAMSKENESKQPDIDEDFYNQYDEDYWHSLAGGKKREKKKTVKMVVSGKSVFNVKNILDKKTTLDKK